MYTILTKNGIDNSNTTATYKNYFNTGMRSGVVKGVLNECQISATMSNIISINTGFIFISGHEVVITGVESKTMTTTPTTVQRYGLIARLTVGDDLGKPTFEFIVRQADVAIRQDNLFDDGKGIYEIEMATFSYSAAGITNIIRSFEIITGASGVLPDAEFNIGNVTTQTLAAGLNAEAEINKRYDNIDKKTYTDFEFGIPKGYDGATSVTGLSDGNNVLMSTDTININGGNA